ncbi:MAG: hypothetical protein KIT78_00040 [Steroidobacteraceae bacterium]|nr:hypothetical protein [Steroidobacteraceae bacterium]
MPAHASSRLWPAKTGKASARGRTQWTRSTSTAIIGHPVAHSRSPFIHGLFAKQTGQRMVYRLYDVPPDEFVTRVTGFFEGGGRGLNVTIPHKPAAAAFARTLTARARPAR